MKYLFLFTVLLSLSGCVGVHKYTDTSFPKNRTTDVEAVYTKNPDAKYFEIGYLYHRWWGFSSVSMLKNKAAKLGADAVVLLSPSGRSAIAVKYKDKQ